MKLKHTFYPAPEIESVLKNTAPKKLSERVNELLLKGITKEKEEAMRLEYERVNEQFKLSPTRTKNSGISSTMMLAEGLFSNIDESDEDLI